MTECFFSLEKKKQIILSGTMLIINTYMYLVLNTNKLPTDRLFKFPSRTKSQSYFQTLNNEQSKLYFIS